MSAAGLWADACLAADLLALDPGLGGACVRARPGPARDAWQARHAAAAGRVLRLPPATDDAQLLGGLDLAATLAAGAPRRSRGLLAEAEGATLIAPMAERMSPALAARLGAAWDAGAAFRLVALDEGAEPDEAAPEKLRDRLAFAPRLDGVGLAEIAAGPGPAPRTEIDPGAVSLPEELGAALVAAAAALGIGSLRAPMLAMRVARAAAALAGRSEAGAADVETAARLVLGPRARVMPEAAQEAPDPPQEPPPDPDPAEGDPAGEPRDDARARPLEDLLLEAARAAVPTDVLARLLAGAAARGAAAHSAGAGDEKRGKGRGRPAGSVRGAPRDGARLDLVETLRAAAPWQPLRHAAAASDPGRVLVRAEDFRVRRSKTRLEKAVIFVVDASGSAALARLAETKGAIELMLAQAYVSRQQVALIAFRGAGAETLLPPTRSLVMTKRRLAGLPGGGGTPLAAGLAEALALARHCRLRGLAPYLAVLTDGRANVALDGAPGRAQAGEDARRLARALRAEGAPGIVIDTSNRPAEAARDLAVAMGAAYLPLPRADARALSGALDAAVAAA